jgi:uncharacterized protein (TIGR02246 family)
MRVARALFTLSPLLLCAACAKTDAGGADTAAPAAATPAAAPVDLASVRQRIDSANAAFEVALTKNDADAIAAAYADDAVSMMANTPAWKGKAAIRDGGKAMSEVVSITSAKFHTDEVFPAGNDMVIEVGSYDFMVQPKGAKAAAPDKGKYMAVWKRQADGSWKIYRDIVNSDLPPAK